MPESNSNDVIAGVEFTKRFAFPITRQAVGGLLICGLNWGGGGGSVNDAHAPSWQPKTHFAARGGDYPFDRQLITWLNEWGLGLNPEASAGFEYAISHTNFYLNQETQYSGQGDVPRLEAELRLADTIDILQPSGVILFGITEFASLLWNPHAPALRALMPSPIWVERHDVEGYMTVMVMRSAPVVQFACVKHPTPPSRAATSESVRMMNKVMGPWLENVRRNWHAVQLALETPAASD
jgi:hypothetical protein